ncbi:MAG: tRNA (N(6)-L-threonylcarbamoyladenosine(37)-C(2))-methylthiotransferase MtaB, partial [Thermodesulfobacteriota bacterium]
MREEVKKTFCLTTLGCKANQYDSSAMEEALAGLHGYRAVDFPGPADVCIINTCTVTASSDTQSRGLIRRARRKNPDAVVIVTGCYAEVSSGELAGLDEADYVIGNPAKGEIAKYISRGRSREGPAIISDSAAGRGVPWTLRAKSASGRTRINLKVQDGCDMSCSYCIIPSARGPSRSLPYDRIEAEIGEIAERGFKEIILTGIHLGAWGRDLSPPLDITALLERIEQSKKNCRFRISSIDPDEVTEPLVELMEGAGSICNHLHLPLQSGDDKILKLMRRRHDSALFSRVVTRLTSRVEGIAIGSDVIVGFPGEGQREFENTFALLRDLPLAYLHVFPFSPRSGTTASMLPGRVDGVTIKKRCARLRELGEEKKKAFYKR